MRIVRGLSFGAVLAISLLGASPALAKSPSQARLAEAFSRMDNRWPNISSHDYWVALRDAEDTARFLTPDERVSDFDTARQLRVLEVYHRCWVALQSKEKAQSEFLVGQLSLQDTPDNLEAAREHFANAVSHWDEAIRVWPYLVREQVRGDVLAPNGEVRHNGGVATGAAWRSTAQRHLDALSPR
jgi:hypothetical protein